jgi:zinc transport system substrate-binding protein
MKNFNLLLMVLAVLALACGSETDRKSTLETSSPPTRAGSSESLSVYVVNYPLQYFAERIGGALVEVSFPAPSDVDPAYWAPGAEEIAAYQQADLILLNGLGYAKWLERATLPSTKLVDTSVGYEDRRIPLTEGAVHSHGPEGEHSHKGYAFTGWLDPRIAQEQARAIAAALVAAAPESEATFQANLESLIADLQALEVELEAATQAIGDRPLLFSHPVYQYLEAGYGLAARSVHWEPGEPVSEDQWQELTALLEDQPARWMIWEGEPLPEVASRLADLGVASIVYDPCGNRPDSGDWLSVMRRNLAALGSIGASE